MRLNRPVRVHLSNDEFCESELLTHAKFKGVVKTTALRVMMKRPLQNRGIVDQAAHIAAAAARLVRLEIIYEITEGPQPKRGPRVQRYAKRSWNEIEAKTVSMQHLEKLGVGRDAFE